MCVNQAVLMCICIENVPVHVCDLHVCELVCQCTHVSLYICVYICHCDCMHVSQCVSDLYMQLG